MNGGGEPTYAVSAWLFLRVLALVYGAAFLSLGVQIRGLVGSQGILPATELLASARRTTGAKRYLLHPTIFWLGASDGALVGVCGAGALLAFALAAGIAPVPILLALVCLYLSLITVCGVFLGFQWDVLLVEAGFLAVWMAPLTVAPHGPSGSGPPALARWLVAWLLFRLVLSSGLAKLLSGDRTWRRLTALQSHYETQPLPTPLAWFMHRLPAPVHRACAGIMFAVELGAPLLLLFPGAARGAAVAAIALFMLLIMLTGNYGFFNPLTLALCVPLLPDRTWTALLERIPSMAGAEALATAPVHWPTWAVAPPAALVLLLSLHPVGRLLGWEPRLPAPLRRAIASLQPLRLVNSYGLFAVMTTTRCEIVIEGSRDGASWRPYAFRWKPDDVRRRPRFAGMHMPRLDWQMWFAALGDPRFETWLSPLMARIREGSPTVRRLFRCDPFEDDPSGPPRAVRLRLYRYRFTTPAEWRATGAWWRREESAACGGGG